MGSWYVKQPNGRLARFSTIVDDFTVYDMTADEALELARDDMGRKDAKRVVQDALADEPVRGRRATSGQGDGLDRFRDCLETIREVHGRERAGEAEREMSSSPSSVPAPTTCPPAPWSAGRLPEEEEPDTFVIGSGGILFARVVGTPDHPATPIARLIAAAPELAAALKLMLASVELDEAGVPSHEAISAAQRALFRATGQH